MAKFQRNYRLTLDLNDGLNEIVIQPPFTLEMNITKAAFATIGSASVSVHNLAESTRRRIFQDKWRVGTYRQMTLEAGYGDDLSTIYRGAIWEAKSVLNGSSIVTEIIGREGITDVRSTTTAKTLAAGTSKRSVIDSLIAEFPNLERGTIAGDDYIYQRAVTLEGNNYDILRQLTNGRVFIENNQVNVIDDKEVITDPVIVINADTGLLDTPVREETVLSVKTLFEPRIRMGQLVEIESVTAPIYNGQYKVIGASHSGTISDGVGGALTSSFNLFAGQSQFGGFENIAR